MSSLCLHCEWNRALTTLGLCELCHRRRSIRRLYRRRPGWTPKWEAHLIHLTRRARAGLPLFDRRPTP
jgi:hypothetical protein